MRQADLFEAPQSVFTGYWNTEADHAGWERRLLSDMAAAPIVACHPGFTGAMLERLVAKGLAVRESAGFMEMRDPTGMMDAGKIISAAKATAMLREYWREPFPQFRYSLA